MGRSTASHVFLRLGVPSSLENSDSPTPHSSSACRPGGWGSRRGPRGRGGSGVSRPRQTPLRPHPFPHGVSRSEHPGWHVSGDVREGRGRTPSRASVHGPPSHHRQFSVPADTTHGRRGTDAVYLRAASHPESLDIRNPQASRPGSHLRLKDVTVDALGCAPRHRVRGEDVSPLRSWKGRPPPLIYPFDWGTLDGQLIHTGCRTFGVPLCRRTGRLPTQETRDRTQWTGHRTQESGTGPKVQ